MALRGDFRKVWIALLYLLEGIGYCTSTGFIYTGIGELFVES